MKLSFTIDASDMTIEELAAFSDRLQYAVAPDLPRRPLRGGRECPVCMGSGRSPPPSIPVFDRMYGGVFPAEILAAIRTGTAESAEGFVLMVKNLVENYFDGMKAADGRRIE
jgi:hypothetical protein